MPVQNFTNINESLKCLCCPSHIFVMIAGHVFVLTCSLTVKQSEVFVYSELERSVEIVVLYGAHSVLRSTCDPTFNRR